MEEKKAGSLQRRGFWRDVQSMWQGLGLTWRHLWQARHRRAPLDISDPAYFQQQNGMVTLKYPYEVLPVPENGRYRLFNEIDDCIVCDLCAKICPVDCIKIESVKATEDIGITSDGTKKRLYAPIFDIDLAKCCYCGLCTTVCPTDCLTMTKVYDFPETDIHHMIYHFTDLTPEQAEEKKKLWAHQQEAVAKAKEEALKVKQQQKPLQ